MIQLHPWTQEYRRQVQAYAECLKSDGCTGVPDFYEDACFEHDIHFRTHLTIDDRPITFEEANHWLGERIKAESCFGRFSPMAWWRERGVTIFGRAAWESDSQGSPLCRLFDMR